jgi:hypothetical protein
MKSSIQWDNHIMRKFGGSIRQKIAEAGIATCAKMKVYATLERSEKVSANAVFLPANTEGGFTVNG